MKTLQGQIGFLAGKLIQLAIDSGLTWDESIAAMGLAANAISQSASEHGDGTAADCLALARKRLDEALTQKVKVIFAAADISRLEGIYDADKADILHNAKTVRFVPTH